MDEVYKSSQGWGTGLYHSTERRVARPGGPGQDRSFAPENRYPTTMTLSELSAALAGSLVLALLPLLGFLGLLVAHVLGGAHTESLRMQSEAIRGFAVIGHLLNGAAAGVLSLLVVQNGTAISPISLLAVPVLIGLVTRWLGDIRYGNSDRPDYLTFRAGALFGIALIVIRWFAGMWR